MMTTLTLDVDLDRRLKEIALDSGRSFNEVVNHVVRRGLSSDGSPQDELEPFRVVPSARGFKPGIDSLKLNQV